MISLYVFIDYIYYTLNTTAMYKRININLDVELVKKAMELTQNKSIKDVVHYALNEVIKKNSRKELLKFKGKVKWEGDLNEMRSI